jgi:hypothetical protein
VNMDGFSTKVDLNTIPLGSYDCLVSMDWLENHQVILDYCNADFTCIDEGGNLRKVQGISRPISIGEISSL